MLKKILLTGYCLAVVRSVALSAQAASSMDDTRPIRLPPRATRRRPMARAATKAVAPAVRAALRVPAVPARMGHRHPRRPHISGSNRAYPHRHQMRRRRHDAGLRRGHRNADRQACDYPLAAAADAACAAGRGAGACALALATTWRPGVRRASFHFL